MVSLEIFDLILMKNEVGGGIESLSEKEKNKRNLSTSIQSTS